VRLLLATRNPGKLREMREILGEALARGVELLSLDDLAPVAEPEETEETFAGNARLKALGYAAAHGVLCVADDSGLSVEPLGGRPGVRSARYAGEGASDADNNRKLLEELSPIPRPWPAHYACAAAAAVPGKVVAEADGRVDGEIVPEGRGGNGFGYDPYFLVSGSRRTMAELPPEEKNAVSHRGAAMRGIVRRLEEAGLLR
jgi:XTP/dITP diphosphohydrolase